VADWTEEPYENIYDKKLPKEFHQRNPQAVRHQKLWVELVPFLLGNIVVPGGFNGTQLTDG